MVWQRNPVRVSRSDVAQGFQWSQAAQLEMMEARHCEGVNDTQYYMMADRNMPNCVIWYLASLIGGLDDDAFASGTCVAHKPRRDNTWR